MKNLIIILITIIGLSSCGSGKQFTYHNGKKYCKPYKQNKSYSHVVYKCYK